MKRRILAAGLWFYALWTWGAFAEGLLRLPQGLGVAAGAIVAAWLLTNPRTRWASQTTPLPVQRRDQAVLGASEPQAR